MMENWFIPITDEEAVQMGMPKQSALFDRLYEYMIDEIKLNTKLDVEWTAGNMSKSEKTISFMNALYSGRSETLTPREFKVLKRPIRNATISYRCV
jgi:maltooligosyltrehalose synthase